MNLFCASVDPAKTAKITFRIYKYGAPGGKEYDCTIPVDGVGHYKLEYSKYVPPHLIPTVPVFGVSFNAYVPMLSRTATRLRHNLT